MIADQLGWVFYATLLLSETSAYKAVWCHCCCGTEISVQRWFSSLYCIGIELQVSGVFRKPRMLWLLTHSS